ncbi:MAG: hypothetical protein IPM54_05480 [Polyangiaceae bacterium]|nr:hypothetical protein [Polyangiaceae bacterium]
MANATASELSRSAKLDVGKALLARLVARANKGPNEDLLDSFIPQLEDTTVRLGVHVEGKAKADAARKARLLRVEMADCDVDTWLRHHEAFIGIEARRRMGPNVEAAGALYDAAFPEGVSYVDAYIPDENALCRGAIAVIRSPEHAATVTAIGLPAEWTTKWEAALAESDVAFADVREARESRAAHVEEGRDAEDDFVEIAVRLRRYLDARAPRSDKAKMAESRELIQPLQDALNKLAMEKASRATRRKKNAEEVP